MDDRSTVEHFVATGGGSMNHTDRIAHVARKQRSLTRNRVREIVDLYLEALAEDISTGEWIDLPGIGKIQVVREETKGVLRPILQGGQRTLRKPGMRLRTKIRLYEQFEGGGVGNRKQVGAHATACAKSWICIWKPWRRISAPGSGLTCPVSARFKSCARKRKESCDRFYREVSERCVSRECACERRSGCMSSSSGGVGNRKQVGAAGAIQAAPELVYTRAGCKMDAGTRASCGFHRIR